MMDMAVSAEYWDTLYRRRDYVYGTAASRFLIEQSARLQRGMKALVPGDGEGRNGVWLAGQGLDVHSVEPSQWGIAKARRLAAQQRVEMTFYCCDVHNFPARRNEFDVIVSIYLHLPPSTRAAIHRNFVFSLRPGGLLILEAFRQSGDVAANHRDPCLYNAEILRSDFGEMAIEQLLSTTVEMNEGFMHQGSAEVVRLIARKQQSSACIYR